MFIFSFKRCLGFVAFFIQQSDPKCGLVLSLCASEDHLSCSVALQKNVCVYPQTDLLIKINNQSEIMGYTSIDVCVCVWTRRRTMFVLKCCLRSEFKSQSNQKSMMLQNCTPDHLFSSSSSSSSSLPSYLNTIFSIKTVFQPTHTHPCL